MNNTEYLEKAWARIVTAHKANTLTLDIVKGVYPWAIGFTVTDGILQCQYQNYDCHQSTWWRNEAEL